MTSKLRHYDVLMMYFLRHYYVLDQIMFVLGINGSYATMYCRFTFKTYLNKLNS